MSDPTRPGRISVGRIGARPIFVWQFGPIAVEARRDQLGAVTVSNLQHKICLITGSTGIAEATALKAAEQGARVFVVSRTEENCRGLAAKLGGQGAYRAADLTRGDQVEAAVAACVEQWGRIDGLFNVAGISGRRFGDGPLHECTEEGWDMTMDANLKSMFLMNRAVLNQMVGQGENIKGIRGAILNMASVLAFSPERNFFASHAYAASKGAIVSMSKAAAAYYAPLKIRVNAIAPALVETPMSKRAGENADIMAFMREKQPLGEMMAAEDVAGMAVFLLGDGARAITGDVVTVDAGWCVS